MTRFCVWGGRPGYVWVGSSTDKALQRRAAREWAARITYAEAVGAIGKSINGLGLSAVQAAGAIMKMNRAWRRWQHIERRRRRARWPLWRDYVR